MELTMDFIKNQLAKNDSVFKRGENIFFLGNFNLKEKNEDGRKYKYGVDGSYGEYNIEIKLAEGGFYAKCDCPYPYNGCKHTIAACLDILNNHMPKANKQTEQSGDRFLTTEEIRNEALESRKTSAKKEKFKFLEGDTYKGEHTVINHEGREYTVSIYDPSASFGHCTCPDFSSNRLNTCKHLIYVMNKIGKNDDIEEQSGKSVFPLIHFTWNSCEQKPQVYYEGKIEQTLKGVIDEHFDDNFLYKRNDISLLYDVRKKIAQNRNVKFDGFLLKKINSVLLEKEIRSEKKKFVRDLSFLKAKLFAYQEEGVDFSVFKKSAIIADEMGLGKTIQAITIAILKKKIFNFKKVLVITPSSLKEQWRLEINKFTDESAVIISGSNRKRQELYEGSDGFFKITNYEAVLRDIAVIKRYKPDFIILDEAQRIKNFDTKTHKVILSIPHEHSLVITGTPLENKLEDLYSIIQFADGELLSPLWIFASKHFNMSKFTKNKVLGYKNIGEIREKIKDIVIRRRKEDVFDSLPAVITNIYKVTLTPEQYEMDRGYKSLLMIYLEKKFLTPMDLQEIQKILLCMRMLCDSTYLIDKKTNLSPKLVELKSVLMDLVIQNGRKAVIFSEWTTMTFLIAKLISELNISFVELSGKVPVEKRQLLIDEFNNNPACMIFLSTDAGGVGLNLQSADCVINFELPWNPAKLNQRIGRVNRIGQKSKTINVVNFISHGSIEEKVYAGIGLKQELFSSVLDGTGTDEIAFSQEEKNKFVDRLREMFDEENAQINPTKVPSEEIPEEMPGYLNPKVLNEEVVDLTAEETVEESGETAAMDNKKAEEEERSKIEPEKLEKALDLGMKFLSTLTQMTTGKALIEDENQKSITVDRNTGEVTLKFKLPGF